MRSQSRWLVWAVCLFACVLVAKSAPAAYYEISQVDSRWEATISNRWQAETAGYGFAYGDDDRIVYSLPWEFPFFDQSYNQIVADTNGNIWFAPSDPEHLPHSFPLSSTGPVLAVWNSDLSSYAFGGVFVEHKTDPERIVVEWQAETFAGQASGRLNKVQAILYQDGRIRLSYGTFAEGPAPDAGSGLSKGDGQEVLNITEMFGPVPTLQGRTFLVEKFVPQVFSIDNFPLPVATDSYTVQGNRFAGATVTADVDTSAVVGAIAYPGPERWQFELGQLVEGENNLQVAMETATGETQEEMATLVYESGTMVFGVDSYANPSRQANFVLTGTRETGATVSATDQSSGQQAAILYPTARSWEANFASLSDGEHVLSLHFVDAFGNTADAILPVGIDTLPPAVAVNTVTSPTGSAAQTVTGTREAGARVAVTVDTGAAVGAVSYPAATLWRADLDDLEEGDNLITVTAEDAAGNIGRATVTITRLAPPAMTITPAALDADYRGPLQLHVSGLYSSGSTIRIVQHIDADRDGMAGWKEPVLRSFSVTDGVSTPNPNAQGDEDGTADGAITTTLNYWNDLDRYHAVGQTVFVVTGDNGSSHTPLAVDPAPRAQSISGTITDGLNVLPGAIVTLVDKWGRQLAHCLADEVGGYVLDAPDPGEYYVYAWAPKHVFDKSNLALITLGSGENRSGRDVELPAAGYRVAGVVEDEGSGSGLAGVWVTAESDRYRGRGITDATGTFEMLLPAGDYRLQVETSPAAGLAALGYVGSMAPLSHIAVTGDMTGVRLAMTRAQTLVCGRVIDDLGSPVAGMRVLGLLDPAAEVDEPVVEALSNGRGDYCLGLSAGDSWRIALDDQAAQVRGYLGSRIADYSTAEDSATGNDLAAYPILSWITGSVRGPDFAPLGGVPVRLYDPSARFGADMATAVDGTYRLGAIAGTWLIEAFPEAIGFGPVAEQSVDLATGETKRIDFNAGPPLSNSIVIKGASYHTRKNELSVIARSQYGAEANLRLVGYGPMTWQAGRGCWTFESSTVTEIPSTVTVSGPEGSRTGTVKVKGPKGKKRFGQKSTESVPRNW